MIEDYHFGSITIDGQEYNHDVVVGEQVLQWTRRSSHVIDIDDIWIGQKPDVIVIGTGDSGVAKVTDKARQIIEDKGIKLIIDVTSKAIKVFNYLQGQNIIGFFHLTC